MKLEDFDYYLPEELIAQVPIKDRDHSRLLVIDKVNGEFSIEVLHADGEKCERCWKYDVDLKDGLCPHCRKVLGK